MTKRQRKGKARTAKGASRIGTAADFANNVLAIADLPMDLAASAMGLVAEGIVQEWCVR